MKFPIVEARANLRENSPEPLETVSDEFVVTIVQRLRHWFSSLSRCSILPKKA